MLRPYRCLCSFYDTHPLFLPVYDATVSPGTFYKQQRALYHRATQSRIDQVLAELVVAGRRRAIGHGVAETQCVSKSHGHLLKHCRQDVSRPIHTMHSTYLRGGFNFQLNPTDTPVSVRVLAASIIGSQRYVYGTVPLAPVQWNFHEQSRPVAAFTCLH